MTEDCKDCKILEEALEEAKDQRDKWRRYSAGWEMQFNEKVELIDKIMRERGRART
jgi:hypothetical protein